MIEGSIPEGSSSFLYDGYPEIDIYDIFAFEGNTQQYVCDYAERRDDETIFIKFIPPAVCEYQSPVIVMKQKHGHGPQIPYFRAFVIDVATGGLPE